LAYSIAWKRWLSCFEGKKAGLADTEREIKARLSKVDGLFCPPLQHKKHHVPTGIIDKTVERKAMLKGLQ
jgi:hypothetical protein